MTLKYNDDYKTYFSLHGSNNFPGYIILQSL